MPQTLVIAQVLLYFDAFWMLLAILTRGVGGLLGAAIGLGTLGAYVYGAFGIANEQRLGYRVAVVASFLPLARRLIIFLLYPTSVRALYGSPIGYVLVGGWSNIISAIFEYALIALLLHQQSRDHQKIWFS